MCHLKVIVILESKIWMGKRNDADKKHQDAISNHERRDRDSLWTLMLSHPIVYRNGLTPRWWENSLVASPVYRINHIVPETPQPEWRPPM